MTSTCPAECPLGLCDGSGWIISAGEGDVRPTYAPCPHAVGERRRRKLAELFPSAGIPERFRDVRLDQLDNRHARALAAAHRYAASWPPADGRGLCLMGDVGTGKSALAYGILHHLMAAGVEVLATSGPRLLRDLGWGVREGLLDSQLRMLADVELLVVDDLGAQRLGTQFASETMYDIVETRYSGRRPLIVTTMLDLARWGELVADQQWAQVWRAIASRIAECCDCYLLTGSDRRFETLARQRAASAAAGRGLR